MKALRAGRAAALLSVAALALTACSSAGNGGNEGGSNGGSENGGNEAAQASGTLTGGGASSQESAMGAWVAGVSDVAPELSVKYDPVGSGNGREGFLSGQYSFAGSDAAMGEDEDASQVCGPDGAFHVPAYISPIAIAYNLEGVEGLQMDAETIAKVFAGEITKWNDPAIADQNEGVELPEKDITVVHRSDDSGTTENFTAYLTETAGDAWSYDEVETWPTEIQAESAQGTKGVVGLASDTDGAITYADASATEGMNTVNVKVGEEYVEYSSEAAAATVDKSEANEDGSIELDRGTDEEGVYPIVLVSYHIYCNQYENEETAEQVKAFASYVISEDGQKAAEESAGNAPISDETRDAAQERIDAIGTEG